MKPRLNGYSASLCPERLRLDHAGIDPALRVEPGPADRERSQGGIDFEIEVGLKWADLLGDRFAAVEAAVRDTATKDRRVAHTVELMANPGPVQVIWNPRLPVTEAPLLERAGEPDFLLRAKEEGDEPRWYPGDVKHARLKEGTTSSTWEQSSLADPYTTALVSVRGSVKARPQLQLAHYRAMLDALGMLPRDTPSRAVLLNSSMDLLWVDLDKAPPRGGRSPQAIYDAASTVAAAIIATTRAGGQPGTRPELKDECAGCPWRRVCLERMEEEGAITLLPGITPARAAVHYALGVDSISKLAKLSTRTAVAVEAGHLGEDPATNAYLGTRVWHLAQSIDQARVAESGRPHLARGAALRDLSADVEQDIDIEDADGVVYLIGVLTTVGGKSTYRGFANYDGNERQLVAQWWDFMQSSRQAAAGRRYAAYCYSKHEAGSFRRLADRYAGEPGIPTHEELEEFFVHLIDLHEVLSKEVVWPTRSLSLKDLARLVGFNWRDHEAGGDNSILWARTAMGDPDPAARAAARGRLARYNADDVEAQRFLREALRQTPPPPVENLVLVG